MIKKVLWPILIGAMLAVVLLIIFPSLKNGRELSLSNTIFSNEPFSYNQAVKAAAPAVVNIYSRSISTEPDDNKGIVTPLGSGVIMRKDGYLITNFHVIETAQQIIVAFQDGRIFEGVLIGSDKLVDLAVVKIETDNNIPVIPINLNRQPKVGDVVLAIGNPYNIGQTITQGIISATGRDGLSPFRRQNFIQTDASINHGNSGGALVNSLGELVGINTLSFNKNAGSEIPEGIGFAIPTALATKIMNKLIRNGKVIRGYIGIDGQEFVPSKNPNDHPMLLGILVTNSDGPSKAAGIEKNDIIIDVDNKPVRSIIETMDQIAELKPGSTVPVTVLRDGEKLTLPVLIESLPF